MVWLRTLQMALFCTTGNWLIGPMVIMIMELTSVLNHQTLGNWTLKLLSLQGVPCLGIDFERLGKVQIDENSSLNGSVRWKFYFTDLNVKLVLRQENSLKKQET